MICGCDKRLIQRKNTRLKPKIKFMHFVTFKCFPDNISDTLLSFAITEVIKSHYFRWFLINFSRIIKIKRI